MVKSLSKTITFYIGVLTMFVGGIIFMIMSDLTFNNNAGNLIIAVLLCFGSAIVFFFANNFLEKPVIMYVMKGIGLALSIGLIVYYHVFQGSEFYIAAVEKLRQAGILKATEYSAAKASVIVALVFSYIALAAQVANVVLTAVLKEDDAVAKEEEGELSDDSADATEPADDETANAETVGNEAVETEAVAVETAGVEADVAKE